MRSGSSQNALGAERRRPGKDRPARWLPGRMREINQGVGGLGGKSGEPGSEDPPSTGGGDTAGGAARCVRCGRRRLCSRSPGDEGGAEGRATGAARATPGPGFPADGRVCLRSGLDGRRWGPFEPLSGGPRPAALGPVRALRGHSCEVTFTGKITLWGASVCTGSHLGATHVCPR